MLRRIHWRTGTPGLVAVLLLSALLALAGCRADEDRTSAIADTGGTGGGGADTWSTIQSQVISGCSCHTASTSHTTNPIGFQSGDYAFLVNQDSVKDNRYSIVKRYNPDQSTLYLTSQGAAGMPLGMSLGTAALQRLQDWINAGAPQ
ncbi:MAG: hypothetical protein HY423_01950 [Candidatus Lambdaproteobacteria bacterium]|nr:hypothetical protein [Candidatus Lambdaproteobacteria bacterium]